VAVAGDYKAGKSTLVNALLRMGVCPTDADDATVVPTVVTYAPVTAVSVERDGATATLPFERLASVVAPPRGDEHPSTEPPSTEGPAELVRVEVPAPLLRSGLALVDCPGEGGLGSMVRLRSLTHIAGASALLFVTDATAELDAGELAFLELAVKVCPTVAVVLTKTDLVPAWREVHARNEERLAAAGLAPMAQLPVSSHLCAFAVAAADAELDALSGVPDLERWLDDVVLAQAARLNERASLVELALCVDQLHQQFESERSALADPDGAVAMGAELAEQAAELQRLRESAARWQTMLADGVADLNADVDHDLRNRLRRVGREADDAIDAADPADIWEAFEPWLYARVADEVVGNFTLLTTRAAELVTGVAELFTDDLEAVVERLVAPVDADAAVGAVEVDASVRLTRMTTAQRAFTALRGSYGGVIMASFMAAYVGSHAAARPAAALLGLLMGKKAVKDEGDRQLAVRRNSAKLAQRRYTDEVSFVVGKYSRDHLRHLQRALRDHFNARAEEFERTTRLALAQTRAAMEADRQTRERRLADVTAELARITALVARITTTARTLAGTDSRAA
jgi:hypothetical protein